MSIETEQTSETSKVRYIIEQLAKRATPVTEVDKPTRCRAVLLDATGSKVLGIRRIRPGRDPYIVYPGGGVEENETPEATIRRELNEELGLNPDDIQLEDWGIDFDGQRYFIGEVKTSITDLRMGGPETERSAQENGSYQPDWIPLESLQADNFVPSEITRLVLDAAA